MGPENYESWYGSIAEYRGQPINVGKEEIEMSFKLYRSKDGRLVWSTDGKPDVNPLVTKTDLATHLDIGYLLLQMVQAKSKISPSPNSLDMYLNNEYLVAMILSEIDSDQAP